MDTPEQKQERLEDNERRITENIGNHYEALYIHTAHHAARQARSDELYAMLGLKENRLPDTAMPGRYIQGIYVWVLPSKCGKLLRVMAECPVCRKTIAAGRLQQHSKVHLKAALNKALDEAGVPK